jgi:hypothetical protein
MERFKKLAGILNEVEVKSGVKATDLQFILRDLGNAYGEGIADDQIKDDFKNYTVGQIKDDWIKLKGIKEDATSAPGTPPRVILPNTIPVPPKVGTPPTMTPFNKPPIKQTADVAGLTKMIQSNSSLMGKLKTVNSGQEVTETIAFILNSINPKASGVNKTKLKSIIDQRFK